MGQEVREVFRVAVNVSIIDAAGGWFHVALSVLIPRAQLVGEFPKL